METITIKFTPTNKGNEMADMATICDNLVNMHGENTIVLVESDGYYGAFGSSAESLHDIIGTKLIYYGDIACSDTGNKHIDTILPLLVRNGYKVIIQ